MACCIGCSREQSGKRSVDTRFLGEEQPVQESWNVTMRIFKGNRIQALITAGHFAEFKKNDIITRRLDDGLAVTFFDSSGRPSSNLTAEKGTVHNNNDMEAFDNVVITSTDSTILRTDYLKRFEKENMLWSDTYVTITKPNETIRGYGFRSDVSLKNYTIFQASGEADIERPER